MTTRRFPTTGPVDNVIAAGGVVVEILSDTKSGFPSYYQPVTP